MKEKIMEHPLTGKEGAALARAHLGLVQAQAAWRRLCAEALEGRKLKAEDWELDLDEGVLRRREAGNGQ